MRKVQGCARGFTTRILGGRASRLVLKLVRSGGFSITLPKHYSGKFSRIDVRFRGALCYIDVYTEPDLPRGIAPPIGETRQQWIERLRNAPTHLCRIRYFGNEDRWGFVWYTYAHEKYEPSFLISGEDHGTSEEAFETSAHFL